MVSDRRRWIRRSGNRIARPGLRADDGSAALGTRHHSAWWRNRTRRRRQALRGTELVDLRHPPQQVVRCSVRVLLFVPLLRIV